MIFQIMQSGNKFLFVVLLILLPKTLVYLFSCSWAQADDEGPWIYHVEMLCFISRHQFKKAGFGSHRKVTQVKLRGVLWSLQTLFNQSCSDFAFYFVINFYLDSGFQCFKKNLRARGPKFITLPSQQINNGSHIDRHKWGELWLMNVVSVLL